ncbi:MAG: Fur family transcriptional regulator [Kofleriaceae bacterium]
MANKPKLEELRAIVRERGLRATPSRLAVLELLRADDDGQPMSHAEVVQRLAASPWDPATIYRNLTDLVEAGLARRTDLGDHIWRFEALRDAHDRAGHPHFVCTECGTIACLPVMELVIPRAKTPRAVKQRQIEVQLRGLCDTCI